MIRSVVKFCLKEPVVVLSLTIIVLAFGWYAKDTVPVDAIPNIGQNQVIVYADWPGRSPKDVEDQVTYPLSVALLAVPGAESVRGKSLFGYSFVQVTFGDEVDFYWARSRVAEQLNTVTNVLPDSVSPALGPDATGLGQIFYYVLKPTKKTNLADLRSLQEYVVKYALQSVNGVSEVASIGGHVRQYQVEVDPDKLRFHGLPLQKVVKSLKDANTDVGAKTIEQSGMEFIIRGKGFLGGGQGANQTILDIENTVVQSRNGVPVRIKDLGYVQKGTNFRRGALDLNGAEAVGGIVVMRFGENPRSVIKAVKEKIKNIEPSLNGVRIVPIYDRTTLIESTIATLSKALFEEIIITVIVIFLFLLHFRTSLIVAFTLPAAVLLTFIAMRVFKLDANIMSLAGIAIAIGNMVDMGIVIAENIHRHLAETGNAEGKSRTNVIFEAVIEIAPAIATATATTVISFLPVFFLTGRDLKLFSPLAWTKTYALVAALIVSIVLIPVLCRLFLKGRLKSLENNPISKFLVKFYEPSLRWCLHHRKLSLGIPIGIFVLGGLLWLGLGFFLRPLEKTFELAGSDLNKSSLYTSIKGTIPGIKSDDWIALDEGSFFYMPTLYPAASFSQSLQVLQTQDSMISKIPEVDNVLGKIGRAASALDPAPASMIETYITLKPKEQWREGVEEGDIWREINKTASLPGVTPASYLQPIEGRVVMLQSGIKAPMAIRIFGDDLDGLAKASQQVAIHLKALDEVDERTINPDIVLGKPYIEFDVDRTNAARYGMSVKEINNIIETALGGKIIGKTVEGRERYPIRVRYIRELRDRMDELDRIPILTPNGQLVPLGVLANMTSTWGPAAVSSENARLVAHVAFGSSMKFGALETIDRVMTSLQNAQSSRSLNLPAGYDMQAVGSFQNQIEANRRLLWLVPLVVLINLFIIYFQFRSLKLSLLVFSGIPLAFGGGMTLISALGVEINTAVWVGFIALFGIAVDNGVILASYLQTVFNGKKLHSSSDITDGVIKAGLMRVRPCVMTTVTTMIALIPVLLATGRGAEVARSMAWPIFGGIFFETLSLYVVPVVFAIILEKEQKISIN